MLTDIGNGEIVGSWIDLTNAILLVRVCFIEFRRTAVNLWWFTVEASGSQLCEWSTNLNVQVKIGMSNQLFDRPSVINSPCMIGS